MTDRTNPPALRAGHDATLPRVAPLVPVTSIVVAILAGSSIERARGDPVASVIATGLAFNIAWDHEQEGLR